MSMLNTLPTYAQAASKTQRREKNYREMKNTCTYNEAEKSIKKDSHKLAGTYDKLKTIVITYVIFLLVLFGGQHQHDPGVWSVCRIMEYHKITPSHSPNNTAG